MDVFLQELRTALEAYFDAVAKQRIADDTSRPPLIPHFKNLDRLLASAPDGFDPRLRHFLEGKSYQKAMAYLKTLC